MIGSVEPLGDGTGLDAVGVLDDDADEEFSGAACASTRRRTPGVSEAAVLDAVTGWLRRRGAMVVKRHGSAMTVAGEPDLDVCLNGRSVQIEVKAPGKRPTPVQFERLAAWQAAGALVGWVTSRAHAEELAERHTDLAWANPLTGPGDPTREQRLEE